MRSLVAWHDEAVGTDAVAEKARAMKEQIEAGSTAPDMVVIEDVSSFLSSSAEMALEDLIKTCRTHGVFIVTDCETGSMGSWPLQMAVKAARHGVALQPDQIDGDNVFRTSLPRVARGDFPPGRGFYIRGGRAYRFQAALPEVEAS